MLHAACCHWCSDACLTSPILRRVRLRQYVLYPALVYLPKAARHDTTHAISMPRRTHSFDLLSGNAESHLCLVAAVFAAGRTVRFNRAYGGRDGSTTSRDRMELRFVSCRWSRLLLGAGAESEAWHPSSVRPYLKGKDKVKVRQGEVM